jgi:hypothetical protein
MEGSVLAAPPPRAAAPAPVPRSDAISWPARAALFASTSVVFGVLWDISWHQSIGRDTFWSPPHLAIYLGGVVAGIVCGWHVLRVSFFGTAEERGSGVTWWRHFRGPLGAWACIWGAIAMVTSAPFDDWWHNAYGLDVKILSPPHVVLALGILAIQLGAMLMVLAQQNRSVGAAAERGPVAPGPALDLDRRVQWLFAYAAGLVLLNFAVISSEYTWRVFQHSASFYQVVAGALVFPLVAAAGAGRSRWSATATAAVYTGFLLLLVWTFPLFSAEPKLAPVRFALDRMVPPQYPLLILVPAIGIDLVLRNWNRARGWLLAATIGLVFVIAFAAVQWPFADLLNSEYAHNHFFGQHIRPYMLGPESYFARGEYVNPDAGATLLWGLAIAVGIATLGARVGVGAANWLRAVQR